MTRVFFTASDLNPINEGISFLQLIPLSFHPRPSFFLIETISCRNIFLRDFKHEIKLKIRRKENSGENKEMETFQNCSIIVRSDEEYVLCQDLQIESQKYQNTKSCAVSHKVNLCPERLPMEAPLPARMHYMITV